MQTELLRISGMNCGGCVSNVTNALGEVRGVSDVDVSLAAAQATVRFDERLTSREQLKAAVRNAGYGVDGTGPAHGHHGQEGCGGSAATPEAAGPGRHAHRGKGGCCG